MNIKQYNEYPIITCYFVGTSQTQLIKMLFQISLFCSSRKINQLKTTEERLKYASFSRKLSFVSEFSQLHFPNDPIYVSISEFQIHLYNNKPKNKEYCILNQHTLIYTPNKCCSIQVQDYRTIIVPNSFKPLVLQLV